jgi:hypothetical protein
MSKRVNPDQYYAAEMARLDADHAAGKVTDGQYELFKSQIIANATASKRKRSPMVTFLLVVAVIAVCWLIWVILRRVLVEAVNTWPF